MTVTFIILWFLAFLMLKYDWRTVSTRWGALLAFCGGSGAFGRAWLENFAPYLDEHGLGGAWLEAVTLPLYNTGSYINTVGLPYAFLLFACSYSGRLSAPQLRTAAWLGALPLPIMLWFISLTPAIVHNYRILLLWVVPYIAVGTALLLYTYIRAARQAQPEAADKQNHRIILLLALPPVLLQFMNNYLLRAFDFHQAWRFNVISITLLLLIYLTFAYRHGLFGLQLKFGRARMEHTLQAFSSGSTLLQHTVKSETAKIMLLSEQLNNRATEQQWEELQPSIQHIQASARHLIRMMERLQHHAQEIMLFEEPTSLRQLLDSSLLSIRPLLEQKRMTVERQLPPATDNIVLLCDPVHMQEALQNLLVNAIEASQKSGKLILIANASSKAFTLSIRDYGIGIAKQHLSYVLDPFYTTKSLVTNYGLGLTYCHKVMTAHGGMLHITSKENSGTTVRLQWPQARVSSASPQPSSKTLHVKEQRHELECEQDEQNPIAAS